MHHSFPAQQHCCSSISSHATCFSLLRCGRNILSTLHKYCAGFVNTKYSFILVYVLDCVKTSPRHRHVSEAGKIDRQSARPPARPLVLRRMHPVLERGARLFSTLAHVCAPISRRSSLPPRIWLLHFRFFLGARVAAAPHPFSDDAQGHPVRHRFPQVQSRPTDCTTQTAIKSAIRRLLKKHLNTQVRVGCSRFVCILLDAIGVTAPYGYNVCGSSVKER